jgi:hypothetical protein
MPLDQAAYQCESDTQTRLEVPWGSIGTEVEIKHLR